MDWRDDGTAHRNRQASGVGSFTAVNIPERRKGVVSVEPPTAAILPFSIPSAQTGSSADNFLKSALKLEPAQ